MRKTPTYIVPRVRLSSSLSSAEHHQSFLSVEPTVTGPFPIGGNQRAEFLTTLDDTIQRAYESLQRTQARYKHDFDKRVRLINARLKPGNYVYLNPTNGAKTSHKLASPAVGPYRVLANDKRTITIDRDGVTECVSADHCVHALPPTHAPRASTTTPSNLAGKVNEVIKYAVERLLRHPVMEGGTTEFLIKWPD